MKIKRVILENFRGFRRKAAIDFSDLTIFVGRNDVGKSTVLEALDLFFNEGKGAVKCDKGDLSVGSDAKEFAVSVVFSDLPGEIILDDTAKTSLSEEYLLNEDGDLEVCKTFNGSKVSGTCIRALHPTHSECCDLLQKKQKELQAIIKQSDISCENMKSNPVMRKAIWTHFGEHLECKETDVPADKEDAKAVWEKLQSFLPVYSLFRADRENTDGDPTVQDPMKSAAEQFLKSAEIQEQLNGIAVKVREQLQDVADRTMEALKKMEPKVADGLKPVIPSVDKLKWADVFKNVSVTGEDDIPLNKRGSGVKRLVLIAFFRAEAERRQRDKNTGIVYAIEEPETSQHFKNQLILADALKKLSGSDNTQVILTTHGNVMVKALGETKNVRLISDGEDGTKIVQPIMGGLLGYPSLNEINCAAFGAITEEYHDELWGWLGEKNLLAEYEKDKPTRPYKRMKVNQETKEEKEVTERKTLSRYIRDQIHHPENKRNEFTREELEQSVEEMREFIKAHRS